MKSPFPGMDPYIEACGLWEDFHQDLIAQIKAAIARGLPENYAVRSQYRAYVVLAETEGKKSHAFVTDAGVASLTPPQPSAGPGGVSTVAELATETEPRTLRAFIAEEY